MAVSASNRDPELAEALRERIVAPREASIRIILIVLHAVLNPPRTP